MKALSVAVLIGSTGVAAACGASPSAPSTPPMVTPFVTPSPGLPVNVANVIALSAPGTPPSSPTDPLVGRYTLDIESASTAGTRCTSIPSQARRRAYTADIHPFRTYYAVKLYDGTFLRDDTRVGYSCSDSRLENGGICNQFILQRGEGSSLSIVMENEDERRGGQIWEVLVSEIQLLAVFGAATGSFDDGRISATGNGGLWYGNGLPASVFAGCDRGAMTWSFRRR